MEFEAGLQWMIREDYGTDWASEAHEKARDRQHRGEPTWCGKRLRVKAGKTMSHSLKWDVVLIDMSGGR
ncbi:hypothetical protein Csa_009706 [Cucumis sativus]|uniref:Uncharacterized protein n=1 Tax=Cucumis sativus TaxID=3659 RepID=A0A0A0L5M5_CUCSA|nr:hypothetical protein Csa_009706 [Cucumis sativus]